MSPVLTDDGTAEVMVLAILWYTKGIVDAGNNNQKPTNDRQDLVGPESLGVVRLSTRERVSCEASHFVSCGFCSLQIELVL